MLPILIIFLVASKIVEKRENVRHISMAFNGYLIRGCMLIIAVHSAYNADFLDFRGAKKGGRFRDMRMA